MVTVIIAAASCNQYSYITPDRLFSADKGGMLILDLRQKAKYDDAHISGAVSAEFNNSTFSGYLDTLDKSREIVIYCGEGIKSEQAAGLMAAKGFRHVKMLKGGYSGWVQKGYPTGR